MKKTALLLFFLFPQFLSAQYNYEPSEEYPFGRINPSARGELADFQPLIGESECSSVTRNPDQSWADPVPMLWRFKYIMDGMAVQDETLKEDGTHSGSIRQFNSDSLAWYVHYYASAGAAPVLPVWEGSKKDDGNIVLYRPQVAPNGMEGYYRLTFFDISDDNFEWIGEWVDLTEKIIFPTWKISCTKKD
ncbi:MAG: hypothetical protein ED557_00285 [Balneola sp.]|nr:MAG: hypothetical protein ED557_00285 [Balneola sp.]